MTLDPALIAKLRKAAQERDAARADALAAVQRKIELVKERDRLRAVLQELAGWHREHRQCLDVRCLRAVAALRGDQT